jgi:metal-responsive CopG/Arc/MetJ family transcriptional regulator
VNGTWREQGFDSRSEFIRYALRGTVNHPGGAGLRKDIAIGEYQASEGRTVSSAELKEWYGLGDE